MKPEFAILRITAVEITFCLFIIVRPCFCQGEFSSDIMINEGAFYSRQGHTFQVIMNHTDVCTLRLGDVVDERLLSLDYLNRNFGSNYADGHLHEMIDRIVRERLRDYRNQRRRSRHRIRHQSRLRKQRHRRQQQQQVVTEIPTRERRSTEVRGEGCLPVEAFGLETDQLRNTDGSTTRIECCYSRGYSVDHDGYLSLCAACSATTTLTNDYFPRDIHEHVCLGQLLTSDTSDHGGCIKYAETWHGKCSQKTVYQTVLKRKAKACSLQLDAQQHLSVEEWNQEVVPVRSGCECRMNQLSALRGVVNDGL